MGDFEKYTWRDNGSGLVVKFSLATRIGYTDDMVLDTVANFLHAAKCLWKNEFQACDEYINRAIDRDWPVLHNDPRVHIFGDLAVNGGEWEYKVNICNEFTSAQMILDMAGNKPVINQKLKVWGCEPVGNGNGKPQSKPQQQAQQQKPNPTVMNSYTGQTGHEQPQQQTPEGIIVLDYDYRQKAAYEAKYANKLVSIPFAKLRRAINARKDGKGSYEVVEAYGWYEGQNGRMVSKYPTYNIFAPKPDAKFSDWHKFYQMLNDSGINELAEPGTEWEQPGQLVIKINKKETGTYWNLQNVVFDDEYIPSASQSDAPDWGQDDIPWSDDDPDNDPGRHLDM
jgi:hypothetical protein